MQHLVVAAQVLPPVEFTMHRYSQYEGKGVCWQNGPTFYTCSMGHKIKIYLKFEHHQKYINIGLQNVAGEFDDQPQWSLPCTLSTQHFDQWGEHHLERVAYQIKKGQCHLHRIWCFIFI